MIKDMAFCKSDPLTRRYVMPKSVLQTAGQVEAPENLLAEKDGQIGLAETVFTVLRNGADGEQASVLLDFGTELAGGIRLLTYHLNRQAKMRLVFGESVAEAMSDIGVKNATNDHSPRDFVVEISQYSDLEFGRTGFRFVRLILLSPDTELKLKSALAVFTYRDIPYVGSFCCSDPLLNEIYDTAAYTCHLNMQEHLWDGVKRDRLVWAGDMHPEMLTIRTVFGNNAVMEESLERSIEHFPLPLWPNHMVTYAFWLVLIVRDWYMATGDDTFLRRHADYFTGLLRQMGELVTADGEDRLAAQGEYGYFLDWPTWGKVGDREGARSLLALAFGAGADLARLLSEQSLAAACEERVAWLAAKTFPLGQNKTAGAMAALAGHLPPAAGADLLMSGGMSGFSTFMSFYQLSALANAGRMDDALDVLRRYYGGMLAAGATSFWEDFDLAWLKDGTRIDRLPDGCDIHGDNGAYCYVGYRHSLCHGWSSGPTAFLAERVLGVHIDEPGCRKITLKPALGGLAWARGTYPTPYGPLTVSVTPDGVTYDAPAGVQVTVA